MRLQRRSRRRLALRRGAGAAYATETQTILDAFAVEPDSTRKSAIDALVVRLKDGGIWSQLDFLRILAAHTQQAALINWKNPGTHDATEVNAPTFTVDRGFAGDGATSYLNTNFTPSVDGVKYLQDDASFGAYSRTGLATDGCYIGGYSGSLGNNAHLLHFTTQDRLVARVNQSSSDFLDISPTTYPGLIVARRSASNAQQIYKNGSSIFSNTTASNSLMTVPMFSLARNENGTAGLFSNQQISADFAGAAMSAAEQLELFSAIEEYMDAVGAGVVA